MTKPTLEEYAAKVAAMRMHQRDFFRDRDRYNLAESKKLEREVDKMTEALLSPQGGLL